ncbi:MAG: hypothetical protein Q7V40_20355 [Pseudolabrys sp.]|nr:hypothetical protein [Pseudolabrys sp.]
MHSLTRKLRKRAAILIAVAYAFCVMAPAAALAAVNSPTVFHCLAATGGMAKAAEHDSAAHAHADAAAHQHEQSSAPDHHSSKDGMADTASCCGLFCVSALTHDPGLTFGLSAPASSSVTALANGLSGRAPGPLHRPPIA